MTSVAICVKSGDTVFFLFFRNFFRPSSTSEKYFLNVFRKLITRFLTFYQTAELRKNYAALCKIIQSHTDSFFRLPVSLLTILAHFFLTNKVQQQVQIIIAIMMPPATYKDKEIGRRPKMPVTNDIVLQKPSFDSPDKISWMIVLVLFIPCFFKCFLYHFVLSFR